MSPEEQYAAATWRLLQKIKGAALHLPANHPVRYDEEEALYELDIFSADEVNHLKRLHYDNIVSIQHPKLTGFTSPEKYPFVVVFALGNSFQDVYQRYKNIGVGLPHGKVIVRLDKINNRMYLKTPKKSYRIASFRNDSDPNKLYDWLMNNEGTHKFRTVKLDSNAPNYIYSPSDLARRLSRLKVVRDYFIPIRSKQEIEFRKEIEISQAQLTELVKTLK